MVAIGDKYEHKQIRGLYTVLRYEPYSSVVILLGGKQEEVRITKQELQTHYKKVRK